MFEKNVGTVLISKDFSDLPRNYDEFVQVMVRQIAHCFEVFDRQDQQVTLDNLAQ